MRIRNSAAALILASAPFASVLADHRHHDNDDLLRGLLSTGATTASTYLTSGSDHKLVGPVQDDASAFIASDGEIRGPYLEAALQRLRSENPDLQQNSDMQLAGAILAADASSAGY
ncbi:hypothetical protein D3C78_863590 [compost metagenome]